MTASEPPAKWGADIRGVDDVRRADVVRREEEGRTVCIHSTYMFHYLHIPTVYYTRVYYTMNIRVSLLNMGFGAQTKNPPLLKPAWY